METKIDTTMDRVYRDQLKARAEINLKYEPLINHAYETENKLLLWKHTRDRRDEVMLAFAVIDEREGNLKMRDARCADFGGFSQLKARVAILINTQQRSQENGNITN